MLHLGEMTVSRLNVHNAVPRSTGTSHRFEGNRLQVKSSPVTDSGREEASVNPIGVVLRCYSTHDSATSLKPQLPFPYPLNPGADPDPLVALIITTLIGTVNHLQYFSLADVTVDRSTHRERSSLI